MGNKKEAALHGLSKKERKALEAREAELRAELARREKKAAKKAVKSGGKKKGKATKTEPEVNVDVAPIAAAAPSSADERKAKSPKADATITEASDAETDEQIKARVKAKRERREELVATADSVDRTDDAAVRAYNAELMHLGGGNLLTSTAEMARQDARLKGDTVTKVDAAVAALEGEVAALESAEDVTRRIVEAQAWADAGKWNALLDSDEKRMLGHEAYRNAVAAHMQKVSLAAGGVDGADFADAQAAGDAAVVALFGARAQVVEQVETEQGHVFAAGASTDTETPAVIYDFAKPSEATKADFETNGLGQYKVQRPTDGKLVGYTRVTTYISGLENTSLLELWKLRTLLEGVALNDTPDERGEFRGDPVVGKMRDLMHVRDVTIAKARKADRKGKLAPGELAPIISGAEGDFKKAVNELAEQLLELGGVHEKAQKGTDLHALCEAYDLDRLDGMSKADAIEKIADRADTTPADVADVQAYADAIERAGIRYERELVERVVVNDALKVAGRLDRGGLVRLPGEQRGRRRVIDLKTGRIDYGAAKIAQQLEMYATASGYDLETHERTDLKLDRNKALVIHLPAGQATCHIYVVDLTLGRKGNAIIGQVRAFRNEGKKAIDDKVDLAVEAAS